MPWTIEQCWRQVLLYAPAVPVFLARTWVQEAYAKLSEDRPWMWLRKETHLQTLASRSLSITFTQGSLAITSAAEFVASDAGRQLWVDGSPLPIYTINTVTDASNAILLETYAGSSGAASATIYDGFLYTPQDFGQFLTIVDPSVRRQIPFWLAEEVLDRVDPQRSTSGDPSRLLVSYGLSQRAATLGRVLYQWWPKPTAARTYPALYIARPVALADTFILQGVLRERGDVLVQGALVEAARWPGTAERPNPYFNLNLWRTMQESYTREQLQLALRDDDQAPMDLPQLDWSQMSGWQLAYDTTLLRASDYTLADYY
jgi:hypothetical protein